MSTLRVGNITATGGTGTVTVPTGNQISQVDRPAGMFLIKPTSVTVAGAGSSSSVSDSGAVTFTSTTSLSINGCFTSEFKNYKVVMDFDTGNSGVNMQCRMRLSGTDNTTSNAYVAQRIAVNNTTVAGLRQTLTEWVVGSADSTSTNALWLEFIRPFLADQTGMQFYSLDSYLSAYQTTGVGTHNQTTSYDGFSVYPNGGTITGTLMVYGYRQ